MKSLFKFSPFKKSFFQSSCMGTQSVNERKSEEADLVVKTETCKVKIPEWKGTQQQQSSFFVTFDENGKQMEIITPKGSCSGEDIFVCFPDSSRVMEHKMTLASPVHETNATDSPKKLIQEVKILGENGAGEKDESIIAVSAKLQLAKKEAHNGTISVKIFRDGAEVGSHPLFHIENSMEPAALAVFNQEDMEFNMNILLTQRSGDEVSVWYEVPEVNVKNLHVTGFTLTLSLVGQDFEMPTYEVVVPQGSFPGEAFQMKLIDGRQIQLMYPLGSKAGDKLSFKVSSDKDSLLPRLQYITEYEEKCTAFNASNTHSELVFISRGDFENWKELVRFQDCTDQHISFKDIKKDDVLLFVSHKWDESNNPDHEDNLHYQIICDFLQSKNGQTISHIWIDYCCIVQKTADELDYKMQRKLFDQLSSIQLAISLCDVMLTIPKIVVENDDEIAYTDLKEITERGWCNFEAVAGAIMLCDIYLYFFSSHLVDTDSQSGKEAKPSKRIKHVRFERIQKGQHFLNQEHIHKNLRSIKNVENQEQIYLYDNAVQNNISRSDVNPRAKSNWENLSDPGKLLYKITQMECWGSPIGRGRDSEAKRKGLDGQSQDKDSMERNMGVDAQLQQKLLSLTLQIDGGEGKYIAGLLNNFTHEADRFIVTNLLANLVGFCNSGFEGVENKPTPLLAGDENFDINAPDQHIFPSGLEQLLSTARGSSLNLSNNPLLGQRGARIVAEHKRSNFERLRMNGCCIGPAGAYYLSRCEHLVYLSLESNNIGAAGAKYLSCSMKLKNLQRLNLYGNMIGNDGAKALTESTCFTALASLDLEANGIDAKGAAAIASSEHLIALTFLNLWENDLGAEGAKALAASSSLRALDTLILGKNKIRDSGATSLAHSSLPALTALDLRKNDIGTEGAEALAFAVNLKMAAYMKKEEATKKKEEAAKKKEEAAMKKKEAASEENEKKDEVSCDPDMFPRLRLINLLENKIEAGGAVAFAHAKHSTSLESLNLAYNHLQEEGAKELILSSTLTAMTNLNLGHNQLCCVRAFAQSEHLSSLKKLNLEYNGLDSVDAKAIAESATLTSLEELNLGNNALGSKGAVHLADSVTLTALVFLDLERNRVGDEGTLALAESSTLAGLAHLNLKYNKIGAQGAKSLASLKSLKELSLYGNEVGDMTGEDLQSLSFISVLNLEHTNITKEKPAAAGLRRTLSSMARSGSVKVLDPETLELMHQLDEKEKKEGGGKEEGKAMEDNNQSQNS